MRAPALTVTRLAGALGSTCPSRCARMTWRRYAVPGWRMASPFCATQ